MHIPVTIHITAVNPFNENFVATGGGDGLIKVWDLRYAKEAVCTLEKHTEGVYQLDWSPHSETIIASGSADRRICVWDLHKIGAGEYKIYTIYGDILMDLKEACLLFL